MKYTFLVVLLMLLVTELSAQWMIPMNEDSLLTVLKKEKDTTAVRVLLQLAGSYFFKQPATSLGYAKAAVDSSRKLNDNEWLVKSLMTAGEASRLVGNFSAGLKMQYEANQLCRNGGFKYWEPNSNGGMGMNYFELKYFEKSLSFLKRAIALYENLPPDEHEPLYSVYAARDYLEMKKPDSAYLLLKNAAQYLRQRPPRGRAVRWRMLYRITLGDYYENIGQLDSAYFYYKAAFRSSANSEEIVPNHVSLSAVKLSSEFSRRNQLDSSLYFSQRGFKVAGNANLPPRILDTSRQLAELFQKLGNSDSVVYYLLIANAVNDTIFGRNKTNELQLFQLEEQKRNLEAQQAEERYKNYVRLIALVSITAIVLVASLLLFRSNRIKQKTNLVLRQTLNELRATQSQLIQSEKMASLGELTAGIAHEIQNPLNFVNNFSELNRELIDELDQNANDGKIEAVQRLVKDIKENEVKIEHHGKRADAIVKSMLQHSRTSSGRKELTDINALCDEYLRLAYHGFRAKDKSFNVTLEKNLDPALPKVMVVPHDIGRVILNLINNAFYAVGEKSKSMQHGYDATVSISSAKADDKIQISVKDNGNGIPDSMKAKIFQPFFTTKPTGQGTGLGLSLSYDIIKAHGGTLEVNSKEGEGSEFVIQLPA